MKKLFFLLIFLFSFSAFAQNDPVAVDDSAQVMNQDTVAIPVLLNDYDPDGDTIVVWNSYSASHGDTWYNDSTVFFTSEWFEGMEDIKYKIMKKGVPGSSSEAARIYIDVHPNPDVPFAIDDSLHAKFLEPTLLDVMANDSDPNGDELKIVEVNSLYNCTAEISDDSTFILFTSEYTNYGEAHFDYILRERSGKQYFSNEADVTVYLDANTELPIAVNDTFEVTGGIVSSLDILANDYDPLEDTLVISIHNYPDHGQVEILDNLLHYTAEISYTGTDKIFYYLHYKNNPELYSEEAEVFVRVNKNPDCPIGEADYGSGITATPISVEVLSNDYDPLGDEIEIMDVRNKWQGGQNISFAGETVTYSPMPFIIGADTAYYRIRKKNDTLYYSNWIPIIYELSQNPAYPIANPDSATTTSGVEVSIPFMKNDIIHDTIEISNTTIHPLKDMGRITFWSDSLIKYTPYTRSVGRDTLLYFYYSFQTPFYILAKGEIYIDIINGHAYDSLYINNINAGINTYGNLFCDRTEALDANSKYFFEPHFEVPKGSGKHTIFTNTIWIGGIDGSGELHLAGERFRQVGNDFQAGPIANTYDSAFIINWQRSWKLTKIEVDYHRNNWWKEDYEPIETISYWPGNGNPSLGIAEQLAPYFDNDNNGWYDPELGDYPLIRGDECIFFMLNDDRTHTESQGDSLLVEIHCMAYAYHAPEDSILNNTVFLHYDLINRSENTYYDTYFGTFTDFNLGYGWDDYVGSHVMTNSFYCYNGEEEDGNGEAGTYGNHPPAQSVTVLAGPYLDPDGEDNPTGFCDNSINGFNFENEIIDDERYGLSYFMYFNSSGGPQGDPSIAPEYYGFLKALWKDNTPLMFGGNGHSYSHAAGPECRYFWPGDSDPQNWGTDCVLPNDGFNQNGKWWTEEQSNNNPFDRRGLGSCGPFTFQPGQVQEVDLAYVFANSFHSADSSKNLLINRLMELRQRVLDGEIIIPNEELDVNEIISNKTDIQIYPNPAKSVIYIVSEGLPSSSLQYDIYTITGIKVKSGILTADNQGEVNISDLVNGFYIISVISDDTMISGKIVKQ